MQIFIHRDNQQQGPFSVDEINDRLRSGDVIALGTFAWYEGCPGWMTLDRVPGVFMLNTPPTFVAGAMPSSQSDATGGLIPYKNLYALVGYYLSIFSMIPFVGIPLGVAGIICGIVGVRRRNRNPMVRGTAHAWFAILFSALVIFIQVAAIVSLVLYRS